MSINLNFIGCIRTPYQVLSDCPNNIQPDGPECQLVLDKSYSPELAGLKAGQEILVLYWLGREDLPEENWRTDFNTEDEGVFALRTPIRPNPIGAAVLPVEAIQDEVIAVTGLDCLDKTPLLDIKPAIYRECK